MKKFNGEKHYGKVLVPVNTHKDCHAEKKLDKKGEKKHEGRVAKLPVVLAEPKIQINVEADIPLDPPAVEIKRVLKNVYLTQCKLVPVEYKFDEKDKYDKKEKKVKKAKLFVEGVIRKNIEYASAETSSELRDRIATVPFSGIIELDERDFKAYPLFTRSSDYRSEFIDPTDSMRPRKDKYFFENHVYYNEQPYCELVKADFYEIDYSPEPTEIGEEYDNIREKIVLDLKVKVLQLQQVHLYDR
ncbi:hypothetical protein HXZ66_13505 [Bacillus sp. A116_S68]|jgi:hypothetical protein|nr:hypothetical protein HXZ66_13505 [Bacillus sp. A116_S68]